MTKITNKVSASKKEGSGNNTSSGKSVGVKASSLMPPTHHHNVNEQTAQLTPPTLSQASQGTLKPKTANYLGGYGTLKPKTTNYLGGYDEVLAHKWSDKGGLLVYFKGLYLGNPRMGLDVLLSDYVTRLLLAPDPILVALIKSFAPQDFFDFELEGYPGADANDDGSAMYRYDTRLHQVTRLYQKHEYLDPRQKKTNTKQGTTDETQALLPAHAFTVAEFNLLLINYLAKAKEAPNLEQLKHIVKGFKQDLGQFLGIAEEGARDRSGNTNKEGVWDFLGALEKQRNPYAAQPFDNRKTNRWLNGALKALASLSVQPEVLKDKALGKEIQRLIEYIVHYQNREQDSFVAAHNLIDLIVAGKAQQINHRDLVRTLGDIKVTLAQYLKGELKVPLLAALDKQTKESQTKESQTNLKPKVDPRQTNAFLGKLKNGLATIQAEYNKSRPFVAYLANDIQTLITDYETRSLAPPPKAIEKDPKKVDPVTLQYASENHYATYQVIAELIQTPAYHALFYLPKDKQDKRLKQIIVEIRDKHAGQSILGSNDGVKVTFYSADRHEILVRFEEWMLRQVAKKELPQMFKSRAAAFAAAKAEAKTMLREDAGDTAVWEANQALQQVYEEGLMQLAKEGRLTIDDLRQQKPWKQLFKEKGLDNVLAKIHAYEQRIHTTRNGHYKQLYDRINGQQLDPPKGKSGGGGGGDTGGSIPLKAKLREVVIDYYIRYKYGQEQARSNSLNAGIEGGSTLENFKEALKGKTLQQARAQANWGKDLLAKTRGDFKQVARSYFLNEDFSASERTGFLGSLVEGLAESTFWRDYETNSDFAQKMVQIMQYEGLPLTDEQIKRAEATISEQVGKGVGTSLPAMAEIMVTTLITEGIGTLPAIARVGGAFYGYVSRIPRYGPKVARIIRSTITSSIAFGMAGQSYAAGAGEGFVAGLLGSRVPLLALLQKAKIKTLVYSFVNNMLIKYGAHTATEVFQEYAGNGLDALLSEPDIKSAIKKTFGANLDQAGERLLVTTLVCAVIGKAGAIKGLVADTTAALKASHLQAKTEAAKQAHSTALAMLKMVENYSTNETVAQVTPFEVKAPEKPAETLSESPDLLALQKELKERAEHKQKLADALGKLKDKIKIEVEYSNPEISGQTVQVHYAAQTKSYARGFIKLTSIQSIHVRVGPDATPQHIQEHLTTISHMQRYQGLLGRIRLWAQELAQLVGIQKRTPPPGSALWEAREELLKLSQILLNRAQVIKQGNFDPAQAKELEVDMALIGLQIEYFEQVLAEATVDVKGVGYVAMSGTDDFKLSMIRQFLLDTKPAKLEVNEIPKTAFDAWVKENGKFSMIADYEWSGLLGRVLHGFKLPSVTNSSNTTNATSKNTTNTTNATSKNTANTTNATSKNTANDKVFQATKQGKQQDLNQGEQAFFQDISNFSVSVQLYNGTNTPLSPAWKNIADGCHYRAAMLSMYLKEKGFEVKKIFAFHVNQNGHGGLQVQSQLAQDVTENTATPKQTWGWHVAVLITNAPNNASLVGYVIDPSVEGNRPLTVEEWLGKMNSLPAKEVSRTDVIGLLDSTGKLRSEKTSPKYLIVDEQYTDLASFNEEINDNTPLDKNNEFLSKKRSVVNTHKYNEEYALIAKEFRKGLEKDINGDILKSNADYYINIIATKYQLDWKEKNEFLALYPNLLTKHLAEELSPQEYARFRRYLQTPSNPKNKFDVPSIKKTFTSNSQATKNKEESNNQQGKGNKKDKTNSTIGEMTKMLGTKMLWVKSGELFYNEKVFVVGVNNFENLFNDFPDIDQNQKIIDIALKLKNEYDSTALAVNEAKKITNPNQSQRLYMISLNNKFMDAYRAWNWVASEPQIMDSYPNLTLKQIIKLGEFYKKNKNKFDDKILTTLVKKDPNISDFLVWALASSKENAMLLFEEKLLTQTPRLSCWESVLLAAYKSGNVSWETIHKIYLKTGVEMKLKLEETFDFISKKYINKDITPPKKGDFIFFNGSSHVAIATGNVTPKGTKVITFWPPKNGGSIYQSQIETVRYATIEEIAHYMGHNKTVHVSFGTPNW